MKKRNSKSKLAFCLTATAVAAVSSVSSLFGQTVWTDGTGDWFNAGNWSAGVPSSSTNAQINNGGTAQITASGAQAGIVYLGFATPDSGTLSISGSGRLDATIYVGESGSGTFNITTGGIVSSSRFIIGDNAGSTGTATVSGTGSAWNNNVLCFVGFLGTATLNISSGGQVSDSGASIGESGGSVGTVTVDGAASTWTQISTLTVGGDGTGTLNITNGGTVLGTDPTFGGGVIGRNPGGQGTVTVDGIGSNWTMSGPLATGENGGAGTLHITSGAAVSSSYGILADSNGSTGTATVDGAGSTWTNSGELFVGNRGSSAMLSISNGGKVSDTNGYISFGSASATVTVDGVGSTWKNSGNLYVGGSNSGPAGTGTLRIQNGGTVQATATTVWSPGALEFGPNANITGTLTFDGGTLRSISSLSVGTLTIQGALTLKSNAAFKFELNSSTPAAAKIVANGVTISGATFSFTDRGSAHLQLGTAFVIIDNTSNSAISGHFSNLADNSTFTNNGNAYFVSYEGGTGNDLTITAVPEPAIWQLLGVVIPLAFARRKILPARPAASK